MMQRMTRATAGMIVMAAGLLACEPGPPPTSMTAAASVQHPRTEAELTTVTLSSSAEARLGIETEPLRRRTVPHTRTHGGEVVLPVSAVSQTGAPGVALRAMRSAGDQLQTAQSLVSAQEEVDRARVAVEAADIAFARATQVMEGGAGSARAVDEARTTLGLAHATLGAAQARLEVLMAATLRTPPTVWIRVPVYVGDLDAIDAHAGARVSRLGSAPGVAWPAATPVSAPPSANPDAATVDLFYELTAPAGTVRPGEKVAVALTLLSGSESLVVPWSAVVRDIHGGEWVYERIAPHTFTRRRVQVRRVDGALALLAAGPGPGTPVVVAGAAELFGTEFGIGK
jgi:hypothetical protein